MQNAEIIFLIIFLASFIRSALGFGDALIAMPLLVMYLSIQVVSPVIAVLALIISVFLLILNRKELRIKILLHFLIPAIIAVPVGVYFLKDLNDKILKLMLGLVIISFSIYKLMKPQKKLKFATVLTGLLGFLSGVLGGAYNTNGPPAIFYSASTFTNKNEFKANLQGMLLPVNIFIITGHYLSGLWTNEAVDLFLFSLLPLIIGLLLGTFSSRYLKNSIFDNLVWACLVVIGFVLISSALSLIN